MKTTIMITFVVVVLGLYWPKQQPIANTTTDIISSYSFSSAAGEKKQNLAVQITGYYAIPYVHIEGPSHQFRYKNLQLYPVYASPSFIEHHRTLGPYLTLKEGLAQQKLIITELSAPGTLPADTTDRSDEFASVNNLFIENISSDTIIVLGGEVIQGGKQDRMIAQDFLVPPHSGKVDLAVYCVEHGRWTETVGNGFDISIGFAPNRVREATVIEVFDEIMEAPPTQQSEVWKEVAGLQEDLKIVTPTGALAEVMEDVNINNVLQPYQDFFNSVKWSAHVIGVVAVLGDEIVGCDLFAQHDLFMKYYPELVRSYCDQVYVDCEEKVLSYKEVKSFFTEVFTSEASLGKRLSEKGTQLKHKNERLHLAVY